APVRRRVWGTRDERLLADLGRGRRVARERLGSVAGASGRDGHRRVTRPAARGGAARPAPRGGGPPGGRGPPHAGGPPGAPGAPPAAGRAPSPEPPPPAPATGVPAGADLTAAFALRLQGAWAVVRGENLFGTQLGPRADLYSTTPRVVAGLLLSLLD